MVRRSIAAAPPPPWWHCCRCSRHFPELQGLLAACLRVRRPSHPGEAKGRAWCSCRDFAAAGLWERIGVSVQSPALPPCGPPMPVDRSHEVVHACSQMFYWVESRTSAAPWGHRPRPRIPCMSPCRSVHPSPVVPNAASTMRGSALTLGDRPTSLAEALSLLAALRRSLGCAP